VVDVGDDGEVTYEALIHGAGDSKL
jgi:hypothetical protein